MSSETTLALAHALGVLEAEMATEWLRLVLTGVNGFEATKRIEATYAPEHRVALANYEIAIASGRDINGFHNAFLAATRKAPEPDLDPASRRPPRVGL